MVTSMLKCKKKYHDCLRQTQDDLFFYFDRFAYLITLILSRSELGTLVLWISRYMLDLDLY